MAARRAPRLMSAIAALFLRDGNPIDPASIVSITQSMSARGPDALGTWRGGSVALGHASLVILPEDRTPQPVRHEPSGSAIVFDGRLDARDDLAAACAIDRRDLRGLSDAELMLRAYLARGASVLAGVLGDFAFAMWDGRQDRLICGRDVLGLRPLFYCADEREIVVASELQAVLRGRAAKPNAGMVAEALSGMATSRDETLFEGIYRIPPGCMLVANRSSCRVTQYVRLEAPAPLVYRTEQAYFEHFKEVLSAAVRDRLRRTARAAVMLSGGVDSSTVYAAARLVTDVDAYTVGYDDATYDETDVARACVHMNGGSHHRGTGNVRLYDYAGEIERFRDLPTCPSGAKSAALRRRSRAHGVNVLLNGVGGDECFFGHPGRWTDWLCSGHWTLLWRELKTWRDSADPSTWSDLALTTVQPLIPRAVRRVARATRPRPFPWIAETLARESNLLERLQMKPTESGPTYAITGMLRNVVDGSAIAAYEEQERLAAQFGQDERMPYLDRRVITFALSIPETLRSKPGCPKYLTRQAWRDHLPPQVIDAPEPPDYAFQIVDALEAQGGACCFNDLVITELGWVDADTVRTMTDQLFTTAHNSRRYVAHAWRLWSIFTVDQWYRRAVMTRGFDGQPNAVATCTTGC